MAMLFNQGFNSVSTSCSSSMASSISIMTNLPEEMVIEILSWLPVKSLLQIRTVCKSWQSLISNPKFIKFHLDRTAANKNPSIIFSSYTSDTVLVSPNHLRCLENVVNLHLPPPFTGFHIISSCNGIVCLGSVPDGVISLWNPSTKQYKCLHVPLYDIQAYLKEEPTTKGSLGFGFDSLSGDYKVVRVVTRQNSQVQVELYSTNADSWKEIQVQKPSLLVQRKSCGAIVKEVLYWLSMDGFSLVSFHLHDELFGLIPLPSCVQQERNLVEVLDFKDSVAMILYSDDLGSMHWGASLWMMDDGHGKVSWTKKFTFVTGLGVYDVYECLRARQFVAASLGGLFLFDDKRKKIKNARIPSQRRGAGVYNYTESLVSFEGSKQVQ